MGLSSKQVTVDGIDWGQGLLQTGALELQNPPQARRQQQQQQQQQQQPPPLRCPRCDSANTKFCYYNNYNKSQPRHFCKACRRHWTKGGTLRNVPVGGRRKNKRVKTSSSPSSSSSTTSTITATGDGHLRGGGSNNRGIQFQQQEQLQQQHMPLPFGDQESFAEILYQVLLPPPSSQPDCLSKTSYSDGESIDMNTSFLASTTSLPQIPNFSFGNLSTFGNNPSISGLQSSHVYNYAGKLEIDEEPTTTAAAAAMSTHTPWQEANDSSFMDSSSYWSFDDLTTFVNTDLEKSWVDDFGQKQQGN